MLNGIFGNIHGGLVRGELVLRKFLTEQLWILSIFDFLRVFDKNKAFSFKKKLKELKNKVVHTSTKVATEVKKDTKIVVEKIGTAFERFKEKIEEKFRKRVTEKVEEIKGTLPGPNLSRNPEPEWSSH